MATRDEDRDKDEVQDGILGIARGPAPQTDQDRELIRDDDGRTGHVEDTAEGEPVNDDRLDYGVPKPTPGLHIED